MNKNYNFYLISYLNALLHGLLTAEKEFTSYILAKQFDPELTFRQEIEEFINLCQAQETKHKLLQNDDSNKQIPSLITCRVGDLLRCKCSSKEYEISALFTELERIHYFHPETLKIVRIKNRLHKGTRDILINLKYKGMMLVEMQLAINEDKSHFI